jgi:hypothetical protein
LPQGDFQTGLSKSAGRREVASGLRGGAALKRALRARFDENAGSNPGSFRLHVEPQTTEIPAGGPPATRNNAVSPNLRVGSST